MRRMIGPIFSLLSLANLSGQTGKTVCVQDAAGHPIAGATIAAGEKPLGVTAENGCAQINLGVTPASVVISAPGFATLTIPLGDGRTAVVLKIAEGRQKVEVAATRTPLALDASASDVAIVSASELSETPGFALDDALRQVAGFQLYRRSSSWAANPTSQGISLRGLGSTSPSRTLVLSDEVPFNDPIGGWVRWNEIPEPAISEVEVLRGGASDLYGSSAIGGVIQIVPVEPSEPGYAIDTYGGGLGTYSANALGMTVHGPWQLLAAGSDFHTDGYIPVPEAYRGSVDADSNDHAQSGRAEVRYAGSERENLFARMNLLNDTRQNGTILQNNAARNWRYATGGDWDPLGVGHVRVRAYGSDSDYRQSFSAVSSDRDSEFLTRLQRVPSQELGGATQWARSYQHALTLVAGADVRDVRGNDEETPVSKGVLQPLTSTTARQRATGVYGEVLYAPHGWSMALSSRLDRFSTFDAHSTVAGTPGDTVLPSIGETVFDPRLGVVREVGKYLSLTGSVFRAFRGPTFDELYRTGQVGQTTTLANPDLLSERATGFELGTLLTAGRRGSLRSSYFWTEVNRPITALTIAQTSSSITQMRENLGQLRSRGVSLEYSGTPSRWLELRAGYQYAKATVTKFAPQPALVGLWIPEVPRNVFTGTVRVSPPHWGALDVIGYTSGHQFDDSMNDFLLHGYARFDVEYSRALTHHWTGYVSVQNLLDRSIEVARTPVLSLGTPQLLIVGVRKTLRQ